MRFSIDINSSFPGYLGKRFVVKGVEKTATDVCLAGFLTMYAEGATEIKKEVERKEVVSGCCDERRVQQKDFWIAFVDGCGDGLLL